ncbi:MAG: formylglycine-generating enzyme family protein [Polyangiales bacterium]
MTTPPSLDRADDVVTLSLGAASQRFRWVPPGTFTMGELKPRRRTSYDQTGHVVTLTAGCWLGEAPVTRRFWAAVTDGAPDVAEPDHPVTQVSWDDCDAFLARLNALVPGLAAEFPLEAWWERACRAGTDGETWVGRASLTALDPFAWCVENNDRVVHPVATKAPNPWGFYDLLGNVWEWCADWYRAYPAGPVTDPTGPGVGGSRVARGGMYLNAASKLSAPRRVAFEPNYRDVAVGFRLAHPAGEGVWDAPAVAPRAATPPVKAKARAKRTAAGGGG